MSCLRAENSPIVASRPPVQVSNHMGDTTVGIHRRRWVPAQFVVPIDAFGARTGSDDVAALVSFGYAHPIPMGHASMWWEPPSSNAYIACALARLPAPPQRCAGPVDDAGTERVRSKAIHVAVVAARGGAYRWPDPDRLIHGL